ncbi:hypothetical protein DM860_014443 [Cuscuta australis]|uniref:Uncharacterized protein n=1 Tax=Cuscuta australis TaxID=267555 RepID=A0A328DU26_9ASTE|nr:hypothetical protein DM860_014443 [Cuscuta australis]
MAVIPRETEFGDLCDEIAQTIFSFVPSEIPSEAGDHFQIMAAVDCQSPAAPPTRHRLRSFGGAGISQKSVFLKLHYPHNAELCTVYSSAPNKFPFLIDSCNGLILYGSVDDKKTWNYQARPLTALPLAFDPRKNAQFKVVGFFWNEVNPLSISVNSMVFRSESWEWMQKQGKLLNSGLIS